MKIAFLDSTAVIKGAPDVVSSLPGSPAYFSRFVIKRLRDVGHKVITANGFNEDMCSQADVVICEWANQEAYEAAASGVCKRLVVRMRGFDMHGPLDRMTWGNIDKLVYESEFVREFVRERGMESPIDHAVIMPSGIDLTSIPYRERRVDGDRVVALVARCVADKGYQLAFEWARQRPDIRLHVTTALSEHQPRLITYLRRTKPVNVTIHDTVHTGSWLNEIGATHILSASIWETLGYTIVEGMAAGCMPLLHDAPGITTNWPARWTWRSFDELNKLVDGLYDSEVYRNHVLDRFDERIQSQRFIDMLMEITK